MSNTWAGDVLSKARTGGDAHSMSSVASPPERIGFWANVHHVIVPRCESGEQAGC
jgi:hypothetical protein